MGSNFLDTTATKYGRKEEKLDLTSSDFVFLPCYWGRKMCSEIKMLKVLRLCHEKNSISWKCIGIMSVINEAIDAVAELCRLSFSLEVNVTSFLTASIRNRTLAFN